MPSETTRRYFLRAGTVATAGLVAGALALPADEPAKPRDHEHGKDEYPRPAGTRRSCRQARDRGKLVRGFRAAGLAPVAVETPDLPKLPFR